MCDDSKKPFLEASFLMTKKNNDEWRKKIVSGLEKKKF